MAAIHSEEFKRDAVRIALTSGLTRRQVASGLGVGLSTLGKWIRAISDEAQVPERDADLLRENERLRRENRILRDVSRIRKQSGGTVFPAKVGGARKGGSVLRGSKAIKFQFIANYRGSLSRNHPCRMMGVTDRGLHRSVSPVV